MTAQGEKSKQAFKIKKTANRASKQRNSQTEPNKAADNQRKQPIGRANKETVKQSQIKQLTIKENSQSGEQTKKQSNRAK